jgi:Winged helix domain, variant/ATPase family associated with various cellular activities (AAA)
VAAGYASSLEHLADELARADQLVRAQTERWRHSIASTKPDESWGMAYVDDAEVGRYLSAPFRLAGQDASTQALATPYRGAAQDRERDIAARRQATADDVPLRLDLLVRRFGLDDAERDLLLLCLLPELDARFRRLYGYLHDDVGRGFATVGLLDEMLAPPAFAARQLLGPDARLIENELIVLAAWTAAEGPATRAVRIEDRIVDYLTDVDRVDARLAGAVRDLALPSVGELAPAQVRLLEALTTAPGARIVFTGGDSRSRRDEAAAIGAQLRMPVLLASAPAAAEPHGPHLVALAFREATLRSALLLWEDCEALFDRGRPLPAWATLLRAASQYRWPTMLDHAAPWDPEDRAASTRLVRWPLPRLDVGERQARWAVQLTDIAGGGALAQRLAQTFDLTGAQIEDAAAMAADLALLDDGMTVTADHLLEACRRQSGRRLLTFTQRVAVPSGLDLDAEIVLPVEQKRQLHDLVDRIRLRNVLAERHPQDAWRRPSGVVCLFTGSSGTGKTLGAACVASALGKDLLRVDLPAVVSKWVGETEKNLQQVFAEAEDANAVMFFDEAEAFFAKRGEVKGAQDRWAMMETDYLLQRIEGYTGAVILATNLRQHIDEAFLRRIHVIVEFPFPDKDQRTELWIRALQRRLPDRTQRQIVDEFCIQLLAERYSLSGAAVESIVEETELSSLRSKSDGSQFHYEDILRAVSNALSRMGKPRIT